MVVALEYVSINYSRSNSEYWICTMLRQSEKLCTHAFLIFVDFFLTLVLLVPIIPSLLTACADKGVTECPSPIAALRNQSDQLWTLRGIVNMRKMVKSGFLHYNSCLPVIRKSYLLDAENTENESWAALFYLPPMHCTGFWLPRSYAEILCWPVHSNLSLAQKLFMSMR